MLPLVSHVEYALLALLRLEKKTGQTDDGQMDGRMDARPLHCAYRAMRRAIAFLRHFVFLDYRSNI